MYINFGNDHPRVRFGSGIQIDGTYRVAVRNYRYLSRTAVGYFSGTTIADVAVNAEVGRVVSAEFNATSDRRLKKDILEIPEDVALSFLYNVKPVSYKWNEYHPSFEEDRHRIGYIAQDVIKHGFPNLVSFSPASEESCKNHDLIDEETGIENPQDAFFTFNYDDSIGLLHRSLLSAFEKINELENKIQNLENMENKIQELENLINHYHNTPPINEPHISDSPE